MCKQIYAAMIIAFLFLTASQTFAITADNKHSGVAATHQENTDINSPLVSMLKEQLQSERQNNDKILQTVYWALGVIATLTFALMGFGWFANFRMYERDKVVLKQVLEAELTNIHADNFNKLSAAINARFEALQSEINTAISRQIESSKRLERSISDEITKAVNLRIDPINHNLQSLETLANEINIDLQEHQARYCFDIGQLSPGVHFINEAIKIALEAKRPWHIQDHLKRLEVQLVKGGAIQPDVIIDIVKTLESLKEEVTQTQKEKILGILKEYSPQHPRKS